MSMHTITNKIKSRYHTPLSVLDKSSRHAINKGTEDLNNIINQFVLTETFGTLQPITE